MSHSSRILQVAVSLACLCWPGLAVGAEKGLFFRRNCVALLETQEATYVSVRTLFNGTLEVKRFQVTVSVKPLRRWQSP